MNIKKQQYPVPPLTCLINPLVEGFAEFGFWKKDKVKHLKFHKNEGVEFSLVTKGMAVWEIEGKKQEVREGEVFWSYPWEWHGGNDESQSSYECSFLIFRLKKKLSHPPGLTGFHPAFGIEQLFVKKFSTHFNAEGPRIFTSSDLFKSLMSWIIAELSRMEKANPEKIHTMGKSLLMESLECMEVFNQESQHKGKKFIPLKVRQLIKELALHPETSWTLEAMAEYCRLKRTQFSSYFLQETGDSPMMYLSRIRVKRARELLLNTTLSITAVAMECGFNTSQYFSKVFRDYSGKTPSEFKRLTKRSAPK